jgi:Zn-dependent protease with chaperone function
MSVAAVLAAALTALLVAPHLLTQRALAPTAGIALWSSMLILRATLAVSIAIIVIFFLPATQLFSLLTHWCLHAVVPFIATHLGFDGHTLGDAAIVVPAMVMAVSLLSVGFGVWRGARTVRRWVQRSSLGPGPAQSLIVGGDDVVVAAAGLRQPRIVVSAGALLSLDDAELAAGLEHERGHVSRHHRYITLVAELCFATSRFLPGGRKALRALRFHLERDADDYAVRHTGDPLALASAICKAAETRSRTATPSFASLAGSGVAERLRRLASAGDTRDSRAGTAVARALVVATAVATLSLMAATPTLASVGVDQVQAPADSGLDCE